MYPEAPWSDFHQIWFWGSCCLRDHLWQIFGDRSRETQGSRSARQRAISSNDHLAESEVIISLMSRVTHLSSDLLMNACDHFLSMSAVRVWCTRCETCKNLHLSSSVRLFPSASWLFVTASWHVDELTMNPTQSNCHLYRLNRWLNTQPFYCSSGICTGSPGWAGTRKVKPGRLKPIWIYWSKR